ncbi:helix-turn-helix domain-containing protein [Micromonospora sp. LOL_015]|uniref:helix-turn-helix domain-containing protein n=1 Tax=Micromonospora sp. LOL_015 TaxID=3345416 RepID=UPI003A848BC8
MAESEGSSFSRRLGQLRTERGMSLRQLARATFYSKSYLHELESGSKRPTAQAAQRLDSALRAGGELSALADTQRALSRRQFVAGAGLAAALPHTYLDHGCQIGADLPNQLVERTARLRRLDDFLGGADTYQMYAAELDSTDRLIRDGRYAEDIHRRLLAVLAEQAQLAGWAAFDAGRHGDAERLYQASLTAAQEADSPALAGNAQAFLAYQAIALGRSGLNLAIAACETAKDGATPRVLTLLHCRRAWTHALQGQAAEAERQLDTGARWLSAAGARVEPDWVYWVDDVEVDIMTGRCWSVLHRPMRAISVLEHVLALYSDTHARDKALYLTWLADAYLDANEVEQACSVAGKAMRLAAGVGSIRPAERIDSFMSRLEPYAALPCVVDLHGQAAEMSR